MKIDDLVNQIEKEYPLSLQENWDCSGLLYRNQNEITKVLLCLDITDKVAEYAIEKKYNLIISHHPLIFMSYVHSFDYIRAIFQKLYSNKVNIYSMHTNYDNHRYGMNYQYINELGYKADESDSMLKTFNADIKLLDKIKKISKFPVQIYNKKDYIKKVAVCLGAGGSFIEDVVKLKCDTYISSEFKHHEILYAARYNITLIDVKHVAEIIFSSKLVVFFNKCIPNISLSVYNDTYAVESL